MKQIVFALMALVLLGIGCSKEESIENKVDTNYFVRFTLDGDNQEFNENVLALRSTDNGLQRVTVQGLVDLSANPAGLALVIAQPEPITAKTYPEVLGSESPALLYRDADGVEYTNLFMTAASGIEIVVSEISEQTIRGTFKGKVSDLNGNERTITDGSFYAAFQ